MNNGIVSNGEAERSCDHNQSLMVKVNGMMQYKVPDPNESLMIRGADGVKRYADKDHNSPLLRSGLGGVKRYRVSDVETEGKIVAKGKIEEPGIQL